MENYAKFKSLLEYFVAHLHWIVNYKEDHPGFRKYIEPYIANGTFKKSGVGYKDESIQKQISQWDNFDDAHIAINVNASGKTSTRTYLNWVGTWVNVRAHWNENKTEIVSLYITKDECPNAQDELTYSPNDLGLFDDKEANDNIKTFFDKFYNLYVKYIEMKYYNESENLLIKNHNLILTGAPGTGKTYLAKEIAKNMGAESAFVQFHPSYDYTDFVEGLRPINKDGNIGFERKDGVFKEFCKKALEDPNQKFVFIIDEINRGDISKIFGELFFSIDPGYRGESGKVKTQYQNLINSDDKFSAGFYVPENVYILGTMNDIDRSVESMDFAMRRRFAWKEITASSNTKMLDKLGEAKEDAIKKMNSINNVIEKIEGLSTAYHIGPAYFLNFDGDWDNLWFDHIEGLLHEYLRGTENIEDNMRKLENAYDYPEG